MNNAQLHSVSAMMLAPLRQAWTRLVEMGAIPLAAPLLEEGEVAASEFYLKSVMTEIDAFSVSRNPELVPGIEVHIKEQVEKVVRLFSGEEVCTFLFVRTYARALAEQRFPLEAALHVYRCGLKVLTHWIRNAVISASVGSGENANSAATDFAIEYANAMSAIMAAEYVAQVRMLAETEGGQRTEVLNILLSGYDESDGRVALLLKRAGYLQQRQTYCVVVLRSTNPAEMENLERVQRISAALATLISRTPFRMLMGVRNSAVVAVLSTSRRQSGWTAPQTHLAMRVAELLEELGPAVLSGVSGDQPSTSMIAKAEREATIAQDSASVSRRVVQFSDLPVRSLVVHKGGGFVRSVMPSWAGALAAADEACGGNLTRTLRAVADADLNVQAAGRSLYLHANTVYARLERIKSITGLDGRKHHELVELLLALDCALA
jgi:hypothetical protein